MNSSHEDLNAAIKDNRRALVANSVEIGLTIADAKTQLHRRFTRWCYEWVGLPVEASELLATYAAQRREWADPSLVDLSDPLADKLITMGLNISGGQPSINPTDE